MPNIEENIEDKFWLVSPGRGKVTDFIFVSPLLEQNADPPPLQ